MTSPLWFVIQASMAAFTGVLSCFALPAGMLWMQGRGLVLVLPLVAANAANPVLGHWPRRLAALASFAGGSFESIAPLLFPYSLGCFLSLHPWTSPWLVAGGGAFASALCD